MSEEIDQNVQKTKTTVRWLVALIVLLVFVVLLFIIGWKGLLWVIGISSIVSTITKLYLCYKRDKQVGKGDMSIRTGIYGFIGLIVTIIVLWLCISIPRWVGSSKNPAVNAVVEAVEKIEPVITEKEVPVVAAVEINGLLKSYVIIKDKSCDIQKDTQTMTFNVVMCLETIRKPSIQYIRDVQNGQTHLDILESHLNPYGQMDVFYYDMSPRGYLELDLLDRNHRSLLQTVSFRINAYDTKQWEKIQDLLIGDIHTNRYLTFSSSYGGCTEQEINDIMHKTCFFELRDHIFVANTSSVPVPQAMTTQSTEIEE